MSKPSFLRRFFSGLWNVVTKVRQALANILFLLLLGFVIYLLFGNSEQPLPQTAALVLNPIGAIVDEKQPVDPMEALLAEPSMANTETRLRDIIAAIEFGRDDPSINALVLDLNKLTSVGISRSLEIAAALEAFKAAGKPVVALSDFYTQDQYLLATYADQIIAHPMGGIALEGFALYHNYYAEALEKLSVNMHVFRAGKYKSAVEPYLRNDMSADEKEAAQQWLDKLWLRYTSAVESQREMAAGAVNNYIEGFAQAMQDNNGDAAVYAKEAGLVDELMTRTASNHYLAELVGEVDEKGVFVSVPFNQYLAKKRPVTMPAIQGDRVAVITAQGTILPGEQPAGAIGSDTLAEQIRSTAAEDGVKAIVLRVSSGGGSMFASEVIRQQILEVKAKGIPVVVSMGSVAASGGYYIAADADEIWATPTTITGSIGVFAAFPTFEDLLQRVGVSTDGVATTSLAGSLRVDKALNPQLETVLRAGVNNAYQTFLSVVAQGRDLSVEEVDAIAQGRVWSADDALDIGLVDALGGLDKAIVSAASFAELDDYEVQYVEKELSASELFFQQLAESVSLPKMNVFNQYNAGLQQLLQPFVSATENINALQDPRHLYLRCISCGVL